MTIRHFPLTAKFVGLLTGTRLASLWLRSSCVAAPGPSAIFFSSRVHKVWHLVPTLIDRTGRNQMLRGIGLAGTSRRIMAFGGVAPSQSDLNVSTVQDESSGPEGLRDMELIAQIYCACEKRVRNALERSSI